MFNNLILLNTNTKNSTNIDRINTGFIKNKKLQNLIETGLSRKMTTFG